MFVIVADMTQSGFLRYGKIALPVYGRKGVFLAPAVQVGAAIEPRPDAD